MTVTEKEAKELVSLLLKDKRLVEVLRASYVLPTSHDLVTIKFLARDVEDVESALEVLLEKGLIVKKKAMFGGGDDYVLTDLGVKVYELYYKEKLKGFNIEEEAKKLCNILMEFKDKLEIYCDSLDSRKFFCWEKCPFPRHLEGGTLYEDGWWESNSVCLHTMLNYLITILEGYGKRGYIEE